MHIFYSNWHIYLLLQFTLFNLVLNLIVNIIHYIIYLIYIYVLYYTENHSLYD